jgi:SAM-dependent methyltransferase
MSGGVEVNAVACRICGGAIDRRDDLCWTKDGHAIVRCPTCGVLARADLPSAIELPDLYGEDYFSATGEIGAQGYSDYLGEESNHRANARARVRLLGRYRAGGRLLDVGCAAGFFVLEAERGGWDAEGVELSATMAEHARSLGAHVQQGLFVDARLPEASFDAVTMWDYIEHSTDPVGDLRRAAGLLREGGIVALATGDAASLAARLTGSRWHLLTPRHHNFFFTPQSMEFALARAGLRPLSITHPGGRYSVAYLTHKLRTFADVSVLRSASARIASGRTGAVSVPINLFDIMTVVARREESLP